MAIFGSNNNNIWKWCMCASLELYQYYTSGFCDWVSRTSGYEASASAENQMGNHMNTPYD